MPPKTVSDDHDTAALEQRRRVESQVARLNAIAEAPPQWLLADVQARWDVLAAPRPAQPIVPPEQEAVPGVATPPATTAKVPEAAPEGRATHGRAVAEPSIGARRSRPCREKRERIRKRMAAIEGAIAQDPDLFVSGSLQLPSFADQSPRMRARVMAKLAQIATEAYRKQVQGKEGRR